MSSLKELTEDTTDRQDSRKLMHLKTYTFHIFYTPSHSGCLSSSLNKVNLRMRDEKQPSTLDSRSGELDKQLQMQFYNLADDKERMHGLLDLKMAGLESKSKIVGYCSEDQLLALLVEAADMGIDTSNLPIILTQNQPTSDLSIFSGWNQTQIQSPFQQMNIQSLQSLAKKWIQSASEKVDVWRLKLKLKEDGRLQKLQGKTFKAVQIKDGSFQQLFMSHMSLGYHVKLSKNYQQKRSQPSSHKANNLLYGWQKFKNFCCLGASNMRSSTGVLNISFLDDKGHEHQILKHLREYDGSEESQVQASKVIRSDRGIYSLLVSNIDRFHGNKLEGSNCKPGDGKAEIIIYEGKSQWRKIAAVGGEILLRMESECIQMQVGESLYRCWGCSQIRIAICGKLKIAISREVLSC